MLLELDRSDRRGLVVPSPGSLALATLTRWEKVFRPAQWQASVTALNSTEIIATGSVNAVAQKEESLAPLVGNTGA